MAIVVVTAQEIVIGEPEVFFEGGFVISGERSYDVHANGQRALGIGEAEKNSFSLRVITNWLNIVEPFISENAGIAFI
jgi:UDP-N-acetylglucosamine enolpyruvyl transferase